MRSKGNFYIQTADLRRTYLDEAEKTEQQIAELEERLRTIRAAQKKEEDSEIIRAIRSTKMGGRELLALDEINEIPKNQRRLKSVEEHMKMLEQEEQKYQTLRRQLYEDMSNGIVSKDEYKEFSRE